MYEIIITTGLGHMGVKFGLAMGVHTTVISRGTAKKQSALEDLKVILYDINKIH